MHWVRSGDETSYIYTHPSFLFPTDYICCVNYWIYYRDLPAYIRQRRKYMYTSLIMELISRGLPVYCRWPQSTQRTGTHCWPDDEAEHTREKKDISVNYMYTFCTVAQLLTQLCNGISGSSCYVTGQESAYTRLSDRLLRVGGLLMVGALLRHYGMCVVM